MPYIRKLPGLLAGGLLLLCQGWPQVQAASLQVAPVNLSFAPGEAAQALRLSNSGTAPISAQIRIYDWRQQDGRERLEPSQTLAVSPPITQIPPGKTQVVRVLRLDATAPASEKALRLVVDELPSPVLLGAKRQHDNEVNFLLRYSIPVFLAPDAAVLDMTRVSAWVEHRQGQASLHIDNQNNTHLKLSRVALVSAGGKETVVTDGLLGYVLPGQAMAWPLKKAGAATALRAHVNDSEAPQTIPLRSQ